MDEVYLIEGVLLLLSTINFIWKAPRPYLLKNMVKS
jgi:hypothetical protein